MVLQMSVRFHALCSSVRAGEGSGVPPLSYLPQREVAVLVVILVIIERFLTISDSMTLLRKCHLIVTFDCGSWATKDPSVLLIHLLETIYLVMASRSQGR
uniref:Uncharacterized protein n=1 Tax=Compsopogon caeruleus TaxID=31354 RepID=A0A6T6BF35_9RHOD|mmetsp:Transcript_14898/g.30303  ORF Transcript_14898/g.30303 Transcript_14898/m.30303 type:complete len:100 (+) Transcript_14898:1110-1409(+)